MNRLDANFWEFGDRISMSTPDFFRARLDQMIDLCHPLAVLATRRLEEGESPRPEDSRPDR